MGSLDSAFRDLAPSIISIFVSSTSKLSRVRRSYDPETGKKVSITEAEADVKVSPPQPFNVHEVDGVNVLAQDLLTLVPAQDLEDAEFDPIPTTETTILVEVGSESYKVQRVEKFRSGDQDALYAMHLRK